MADIWKKDKRNQVMSKIKSKDTKPERILRSELFKLGFRFRKNYKKLPGKPDIVFPKYRTAVFVNGCFWHFHKGCNEGRIPDSNRKYWEEKLIKNTERDKSNQKKCTDLGWKVLVIWECEVEKELKKTMNKITNKLKYDEED